MPRTRRVEKTNRRGAVECSFFVKTAAQKFRGILLWAKCVSPALVIAAATFSAPSASAQNVTLEPLRNSGYGSARLQRLRPCVRLTSGCAGPRRGWALRLSGRSAWTSWEVTARSSISGSRSSTSIPRRRRDDRSYSTARPTSSSAAPRCARMNSLGLIHPRVSLR